MTFEPVNNTRELLTTGQGKVQTSRLCVTAPLMCRRKCSYDLKIAGCPGPGQRATGDGVDFSVVEAEFCMYGCTSRWDSITGLRKTRAPSYIPKPDSYTTQSHE